MIKYFLQRTNRLLVRYNNSETPSLWMFLHKWSYQHSFTKNFLQICNRILKGANKYHVFRWDWMVGFVGAFTGFVVTQLQELYYKIKIGYKPTTSDLVIKSVLKNEAVSNKLKETLNANVFTNHDIQYYVHQALLNQVVNPQKQTIKSLIKTSIRSLNSAESIQHFGNIFGQNVNLLNAPIKKNALSFLNSETMDRIAANGLKSVLQSLFLKDLIANQINNNIKIYLKDTSNCQNLYQIIKQKVSF